MSTIDGVLIILGMFVVTFSIRFCLYASASKVALPKWFDDALVFVPVSVLAAIIVPMIFLHDGMLNISLSNPWLIGAVLAFVVGLWRQNQLLTIAVGVAGFYMMKLL